MRSELAGVSLKRRGQSTRILAVLFALSALGCQAAFAAPAAADIRLVLQITVDGLRGDLLERYRGGFGEGGFNELLRRGTVYTNAHYQHANTETIVGHTTLATGTFPSLHGMVGNVWFDREAGELAYNIEDPDSPLLPTREEETEGEQVDPAQKISRTQGRSPEALLAPTIGDTLSAYFGGRAKIFGVSGKDRSAVAMAGKVGKAFWFSTSTGDFVTSSYYYDSYPDWVRQWNGQRKAEAYTGKSWSLLNDASTYLLADQDDRPYEADLKGYGRVFPHPFGQADDKLFYTRILVSPVGDQLTLDFSKSLISHEQLGQDEIPDYLSVSFSGVDAVNHFFGPSSLENEDVVVQLDRVLSDLLAFVDKEVGLQHTLIVLSADHGMADMPEYMSELGYKVGRLNLTKLEVTANEVGKEFGIDEVLRLFYRPYLYLDEEKIGGADADTAEVAQAIAEALTAIDGVSLAVATGSLTDQNDHPLLAQIRNNQHVSRSGDIYIVQEPYWFLFDKGPVKVMHGSPWRYDTHVPIIFAAPEVEAQRVHRLVHPVDVAPTIAAVLGMSPPGASRGTGLDEVLQRSAATTSSAVHSSSRR
jgi:predicted AlkP superfamily pyrophosphatase or phosphodiesterase